MEHKISPKITGSRSQNFDSVGGKKVPDFFEPKYGQDSGIKKKWTEVEQHFRVKKGNRYLDELKPAKEWPDEVNKPMFSSFSASKEFKDVKLPART